MMQIYLVCSNDSLQDTQQGIRDINMSKLNNECYFGYEDSRWLSGLSLARGPSEEGSDELMGKPSRATWLGFQHKLSLKKSRIVQLDYPLNLFPRSSMALLMFPLFASVCAAITKLQPTPLECQSSESADSMYQSNVWARQSPWPK
jgi:hypothetical protein